MSDAAPNPSLIEPTVAQEPLQFTTKLAYGAGDLGAAITSNILVFFLLFFFTNVAGLPAGLAGTVLAVGKISDAINDPILGMMSDRTRSRWGRRLPWMLWGAVPFSLLFLAQWWVPQFSENTTLNIWLLFAYYVTISVLFNLVYTAVNLPYTALTPELTEDYNERTSLNSYRMAFSIGGSIVSLLLAQLIFQVYRDAPFTQYLMLGGVCALLAVFSTVWCALRIQERGSEPFLSRAGRRRLGWGAWGLSTALALVSAGALLGGTGVLTPGGFASILGFLFSFLLLAAGWTLIQSAPEPHLTDAAAAQSRSLVYSIPTLPIRAQLRIAFGTRAFLYVIGIYLCSWLGVQLIASILIYFVVSWMGIAEESFVSVAIAVQGTALVMLFVWRWASDRLGKRAVYGLGTSLWLVAQAGLFFLQPGQVGWLYALAILAGSGVSVAYLIPWSMVPDVIELDELHTGQRREGIFYGMMVLLQKLGLAIALFLVGQVLEFAGFVPQIPGEPIPTQPTSALLAIRLTIGPLPMLVLIAGLVLAYFYPLTREAHSQLRQELSQRRAASRSPKA